ncbi:MAG: ABC transporter substrate-binding protein [Alkalispirochaeta sp.]
MDIRLRGTVVQTIVVLVAFVVLTGSLFASGAQETATDDGPVTIEYWHWSPNENDVVEAMIADFEAEHPDIKVNVTSMAPSDYWTRIRLQASQNALPDVLEMSSGFLESWATDGFLYDLAPYITGSPEADEFYPSLLESPRSIAGTDGYFALPYAFVMPVLYFNKDMFDAAGISYPDADWTWDDFLDAAEALTIDTDDDGEIDQWGHHFYGRYAQVEPWIYANDGALIDRDAMRFDPDANAMEALDFLVSLVLDHEVVPPPKTVAELDTEEVFAQGISAMWIDGSWNIDYIRDNAGDDYNWGIAPVPTGPSGSGDLVYGWSDFIAISRDTEHPDAAWQLLSFLAGEGRTLDNFESGKIPAYQSLAEDPDFLEEGEQPAEKGILLELAQRDPMTSFTKAWSEWRGYGPAEAMGFNAIIDAVLNGELDYSDGMDRARENVNEILEREYE